MNPTLPCNHNVHRIEMRGGPVTNATLFLRFFIFTLINAQLNGAELPATFLFGGLNSTNTVVRVKLTHGDVAVSGRSLEALEPSFHFLFFPSVRSIHSLPARPIHMFCLRSAHFKIASSAGHSA